MARIELAGVGHSYEGADAPRDGHALLPTDIDWSDGETHALLGPSGCGKTTLLNAISGLLRPTSGRILFDGRDVTDLSTRERNIAQVFQFPVVYDGMSVFDNLAFPLRNRRLAETEVRRRVAEIADVLELAGDLRRRARELGVDGKQRVALGRGLVRDDVAAILLDEPLTMVDPAFRWALRRKLREVHAALGRTLIHVTHDQGEALTIADRVVVMNRGRVVQVGTPEELVEAPVHTFVATFLGSPGMNLVPCAIEGGAAVVGGSRIPLPAGLATRAAAARAPLELGIRPERVALAMDREKGAIPARVARVVDLGPSWLGHLELGIGGIVMAGADGQPRPVQGDGCRVSLPPGRVRLFAGGDAVE